MADGSSSVFQGNFSISAKLEKARAELLDLSARNRLLNVPRFSKAARTIEVVDERSSEVFRLLVHDGRVMTFAPGRESTRGVTPATTEDDEEILVELPQPDDGEDLDERGVASRHMDTKLQTRMTSKGLQKRLLDLYGDARTLEEEQGVNVLYLALGMLKWIDPLNAANVRHAPLILVPVRLERGAAGERFRLRARPDDLSGNLSLEAFLDRVHKLRLPSLEPTDEFDAGTYLTAVAAAVATKEGWEVRPDDVVLGFFSFAKFLMYRDLDPANWPAGDTILDKPAVRSLLADGFAAADSLLDEDANVDLHIPPRDMLHIVDCDSSQMLAVHDVRRGRDLVVQGPPGTGKSQTISNMIAAAVADGRTVLFVAEKMAALEVVKRRLDMVGVGDACLELHSSKANKRFVLDELKRTWQLGAPRGDTPDAVTRRLTEARDVLNAHSHRLHSAHAASELTPYQVFGQLARLKQDGLEPVDYDLTDAPRWTPEDVRQREVLLDDLASRVADIGLPANHPWRGIGLQVTLPTTTQRLMVRLGELEARLVEWRLNQENLALTQEVEAPGTLDSSTPLIIRGRRLATAPELEPASLGGSIWSRSAGDVVALLAVGREFQRLSESLGQASPEWLEADVSGAIAAMADLPPGFDASCFKIAATLRSEIPDLLSGADQLDAELGRLPGERTLAAIARLIETAERVASAPDASPAAFAATVWDHGVEQAGDLAEAVATLERARVSLGDNANDAAWSTDVVAARQVLATNTGMLRKLNADWRKANSLVRSLFRNPDASLPDTLNRLDILIKGQAALRAVKEGDGFGRSAFGSDWRGERSASAPLVALVDWMRTLRGLGAEPRLIAGRLPHRTALGDMAAALKQLHQGVASKLGQLRSLEGVNRSFDGGVAFALVGLVKLAGRLSAMVDADELASKALPSITDAPGRLDALRRLMQRQEIGRNIDEGDQLGRIAFGSAWHGRGSEWITLAQAAHWIATNSDIRELASRVADRQAIVGKVHWLMSVRDDITRELDDVFASLKTGSAELFGADCAGSVPLQELAERLSSWRANGEQLSKWVAYQDRAVRGRALGLSPILERIEDGRLSTTQVIPSFQMAYFEGLLAELVELEPELGRFDGTLHDALAREFVKLDLDRISAARLEVVRRHHRGIPAQTGAGPVGVLRTEMARKRGHLPIRQLVQRSAPAIQALKPVLMMSPLSVAQFLVPGAITFDLLVMDEASQINPVDALGAIARCRQIVVVGDERQLPPTRFFARMTGGEPEDEGEEASVADVESILGLCTARGLPQRMLRWHYRSRHQSLIAVSNLQFYESKLFIVPSPYTREAGMGLSFRHVTDGAFESSSFNGGNGTNPVEAKLVAAEVIRHARSQPERSLGVATFSSAQRREIQDQVELLRRLNPDCEEFFHSHPGEPFFVKNLENVQGDERDVILISVGYGRGPDGVISMRFGPLGADGGERRLNVLISRAKRRCEVFSSITDEDIDLERAKGKGVVALKVFLQYARTGRLNVAQQTGRDHDSVLEEQIGRTLQDRGFQVHPQVGIAGFFIDLAIADQDRPGRYLLGIECDGAAYHSARSARDRDRLRQAVLEDHGWIIHRVWGSDWFQRPEEQLDKIVAAIKAAREQLSEREQAKQTGSRAVPVEVVTVERADVTEVGLAEPGSDGAGVVSYAEASPRVPLSREMHEISTGQMATFVEQVVDVEGPVHVDEVVVRLRTAWGLQRAGARIQSAVERAVDLLVSGGRLERSGNFIARSSQVVVVRDRSAVASQTLRKLEMLPPSELEAAVLSVIQTGLGASLDEICAGAPRLLGYKAVSAPLRLAMQAATGLLMERGIVVRESGIFTIVKRSMTEDGLGRSELKLSS